MLRKKPRARFSSLPVDLGRYGDNPHEIYTLAVKFAPDDPRMSAERAYLAMHTALENWDGQTFRTTGEQNRALEKLAKRDKTLAKRFRELKAALHGSCFYRGEYSARNAEELILDTGKFLALFRSKLAKS